MILNRVNSKSEDRFGARELAPKRSVMLAVPTLKFEFFPPVVEDAEAAQ